MTTVEANGVTLGVEHFGEAAAPLVLLAGGTTMLSWPDALCAALARGRRHVVRYDLRDCGASTTVDPKTPAYTLRDLAADAAALARELDDRPAHLAGIGVGGMVAQVAALDHTNAFSALTLAGTRPVAPGRLDGDLPDHEVATMDRLFSRSMPDWSDRAAVAKYAAAGAEILGNDPAAARATAERIWDRTPSTEPAVQMANWLPCDRRAHAVAEHHPLTARCGPSSAARSVPHVPLMSAGAVDADAENGSRVRVVDHHATRARSGRQREDDHNGPAPHWQSASGRRGRPRDRALRWPRGR